MLLLGWSTSKPSKKKGIASRNLWAKKGKIPFDLFFFSETFALHPLSVIIINESGQQNYLLFLNVNLLLMHHRHLILQVTNFNSPALLYWYIVFLFIFFLFTLYDMTSHKHYQQDRVRTCSSSKDQNKERKKTEIDINCLLKINRLIILWTIGPLHQRQHPPSS